MTKTQKIIKKLATVFAIILIVAIFSGIISTVIVATNIIDITDNDKNIRKSYESVSNNLEIDKITNLEIKLNNTDVDLEVGNEFDIKTNNKNISIDYTNGKLTIEEIEKTYINHRKNGKVKIYIPEEFLNIDNVDMEIGASEINLTRINCKNFDLNLGAGEVEANYLTITEKADIETGAGELSIESSRINNLNLKLGAGESNIEAKITGDSKIEVGIGELDLDLKGEAADYMLNISKGIGSITYNNKKISNNRTIGNGNNNIDITGGIGEIDITLNNIMGD